MRVVAVSAYYLSICEILAMTMNVCGNFCHFIHLTTNIHHHRSYIVLCFVFLFVCLFFNRTSLHLNGQSTVPTLLCKELKSGIYTKLTCIYLMKCNYFILFLLYLFYSIDFMTVNKRLEFK